MLKKNFCKLFHHSAQVSCSNVLVSIFFLSHLSQMELEQRFYFPLFFEDLLFSHPAQGSWSGVFSLCACLAKLSQCDDFIFVTYSVNVYVCTLFHQSEWTELVNTWMYLDSSVKTNWTSEYICMYFVFSVKMSWNQWIYTCLISSVKIRLDLCVDMATLVFFQPRWAELVMLFSFKQFLSKCKRDVTYSVYPDP